MAGIVADQDAPRGTTSVLSWYDTTRPTFLDLVGDYAGKELFLVEGDSLLRECFEDERIDFDGKFGMPLYCLDLQQPVVEWSYIA